MTLEQMIAHGNSAWAIEGQGSGSAQQIEKLPGRRDAGY
jgi:hypothetical protein